MEIKNYRESKQYYINKIMEFYDSNDFLYKRSIPATDDLINDDDMIRRYREGYYTRENIRKVIYERLNEEEIGLIKELYAGMLASTHEEWLNKKVPVCKFEEKKKDGIKPGRKPRSKDSEE